MGRHPATSTREVKKCPEDWTHHAALEREPVAAAGAHVGVGGLARVALLDLQAGAVGYARGGGAVLGGHQSEAVGAGATDGAILGVAGDAVFHQLDAAGRRVLVALQKVKGRWSQFRAGKDGRGWAGERRLRSGCHQA